MGNQAGSRFVRLAMMVALRRAKAARETFDSDGLLDLAMDDGQDAGLMGTTITTTTTAGKSTLIVNTIYATASTEASTVIMKCKRWVKRKKCPTTQEKRRIPLGRGSDDGACYDQCQTHVSKVQCCEITAKKECLGYNYGPRHNQNGSPALVHVEAMNDYPKAVRCQEAPDGTLLRSSSGGTDLFSPTSPTSSWRGSLQSPGVFSPPSSPGSSGHVDQVPEWRPEKQRQRKFGTQHTEEERQQMVHTGQQLAQGDHEKQRKKEPRLGKFFQVMKVELARDKVEQALGESKDSSQFPNVVVVPPEDDENSVERLYETLSRDVRSTAEIKPPPLPAFNTQPSYSPDNNQAPCVIQSCMVKSA